MPAKRSRRPSYTLDSAEQVHREFPRTFSIPRIDQRRNLAVGQTVKLMFRPRGAGFLERMWVIVKRKRRSQYSGVLDNTPAGLKGLKIGDRVAFAARHVIAIYQVDERLVLPWGKFVRASPSLKTLRAWPKFAVRGKPASKHDSGWKIHSTAKPSRRAPLVKMSADEIMSRFAILDSVLDELPGTAWRWNPKTLEYSSVPVPAED